MDRLLEQRGHAKRPQIRAARNEKTNDGTIFYDVVRGSNDDTPKEADTYGEKIHSDGGFQSVSVLGITSNTDIPERVQWIDLSSQQGWWPCEIALTPAEDKVIAACLYGDKLIEIPVNDDGTLDDTNMKAFDQDTATNLTFYDPSLKEQIEQTRYRGQ